ncbi:MAG: hypothetical protein QNJ05_13980 [Woeseiaceae bacterium]|nr:hypothetical protein [Woeseiaceae bacterium]
MFSLEIVERSPENPEVDAVAKISIGSYSERFGVCFLPDGEKATIENWREELSQLVDGVGFASIRSQPLMAWILYQEGDAVIVQQHCLVEEWEGELDDNGHIVRVPARTSSSADGVRVSEWTTTLDAIRSFLSH